MDKNFDPFGYVEQVGLDLVQNFEKARRATTPGLVGSSMERSVRKALETLLPYGAAIGSGCVIDSQHGTSRQMDVVIYERDICPVFCIDDNPETTYYPCEGVIAVGEIKSRVGKAEFEDAVKKVDSVKKLKRAFHTAPMNGAPTGRGAFYRHYGTTNSRVSFGSFDPEVDARGDIGAFVLTDKFKVGRPTVEEYYQNRTPLYPDRLVSLQDNLVFTCSKRGPGNSYTHVPMRTADSVQPMITNSPFGHLLIYLYEVLHQGVTTYLEEFHRYLVRDIRFSNQGE